MCSGVMWIFIAMFFSAELKLHSIVLGFSIIVISLPYLFLGNKSISHILRCIGLSIIIINFLVLVYNQFL